MARGGRALPRLAGLLALLTVLSVVPPAGATGAQDLAETRGQLQDATRSLEQLREQVRAVDTEVATLDAALLDAATALADVEAERDQARTAHGAAVEHLDAARSAVAQRDAEVEEALAAWSGGRGRVADRAVHAYKYGGGIRGDALVRGVVGADGWHDVAWTIETVSRLADVDREVVDTAARDTRALAALRAEADRARAAADTAARAAAAEADNLARLTDAAEARAAGLATTRAARASVLAELEADTEARAVLVEDLQATIDRLERSAARVLVTIEAGVDIGGPAPEWAELLPGQGPRWAAAIDAVARRNGLDGRLLAALIWTESGFSPAVVSHAGAIGLAQLMPGTARGLGVDPWDPIDNLDGGARYLRTQLEAFDRVDLALAAYNAGPGRVRSAGGVPDIVETQLHVTRVLERYEQLGG